MRYIATLCLCLPLCAWGPVGTGTTNIPEGTYVEVPSAVTDGLVMHFDWEDASGGNSTNLVEAYDVVRATMTNGAAHAADVYGTMDVIQFDAVDDYAAITSSYTYFSQYSSWTFCAWVYADGAGENGQGFVFDKENPSGGTEFNLLGESNNKVNTKVYTDMTGDFSQSTTATQYFPLKELVFISVVFNRAGNNEITFVLNGQAVYVSSENTGTAPQGDDSTIQMYLGNSSSTARTWDGNIGPIRLYNRALSIQELDDQYMSDKAAYGI